MTFLNKASIQLGKWAANDPKLLQGEMSAHPVHVDKKDVQVSTLGLHWTPEEDYFSFKIKLPTPTKCITKRYILSEVSKLFDPLGWLGSFLIRPKVLLQDLWLVQLDWEEPLPDHMRDQ